MTSTMLSVARRNLRTFIGLASFKSENDREAAFNCLDVIEDADGCPAALSAETLRELCEARDRAMEMSLHARIPECGQFALIAQTLDALLGRYDAQAIKTRRVKADASDAALLTDIFDKMAEVVAPLPGIPDAPGDAGTRAIEPSEGDEE